MISLPRRRLSCVQQCLVLIASFFLIAVIARLTPAAFASGSQISQSGEHVLSVYDNGHEEGILTKADTLRDALKQANITLGSNDVTEPSLDEKLVASNYDVTIYRARPVLIVDGANRTKVMTAYRTAQQIAKQANVTLHDEDKASLQASPDVVADGALERLVIQRATPFTLVLYGKSVQAYTQAKTVKDMLKEKGVKLAASDTVSAPQSAMMTTGMTVEIWRNGVQTATEQQPVPFPTQQIQDANQPVGYTKIQTPGVNGVQMVTYQITVQNGAPVDKQAIQTVVTQQPVAQVEVIGTKVSLPPGSHTDWMAAAGISPGDYGYVDYIASREGGWNPCKVQGGAINCMYTGSAGYGIFQATPGSKMGSAGADWATNPITQIRWATSYAVGRYGSWAAAYDHWITYHNW